MKFRKEFDFMKFDKLKVYDDSFYLFVKYGKGRPFYSNIDWLINFETSIELFLIEFDYKLSKNWQ